MRYVASLPRHCRACALCLLIIALGRDAVQAQPFAGSTLSVSIGVVDDLQDYSERYPGYLEMEAFSRFYRSKEAGLTFSGGLYVAGWTVGMGPLNRCLHCDTHTRTSAIAGLRAAARLDHFPVPLTLWGGTSHHTTWVDYVDARSGYSQYPPRDQRTSSFALESGARVEIAVTASMNIQPRVHIVLPLPLDGHDAHTMRLAWALGFGYSL